MQWQSLIEDGLGRLSVCPPEHRGPLLAMLGLARNPLSPRGGKSVTALSERAAQGHFGGFSGKED